MEVDPGKLNKRIYIYAEKEETDAKGYKIKNKILYARVWASVNSISGTEVMKSDTDFEVVKKRFLVRYDKKINKISHDMFIEFAGERYDVKYSNNYGENNEYIEIITEKVEQ